MCGIIGYIGYRNARNVVLEGLKRLEYRGYDSSGIALIQDKLIVFREVGDIENLEKILPFIDLVMMDIKHMDPEIHRRVTGVTNRMILNNAKRLAETGKPLIIRVPVIPAVNDTAEQIEVIAKFVQPFENLQLLELLPFHRLGEGKYRALGLNYPASHLKTPSKTKMRKLAERAKRFVPNTRAA